MEKSQNRKPFQALRDLFHPVDLTHGTCWRTILQFSLPVILSYLLQQVYTISDAAIVGQTLTAQEVAGVNDTSSLVFIFLQFAFGVSAGFCVITSCCVGGRAGPVPARPAPDRPHTLAGPARHLWGRAGHRHGGGPGRRALQRPRQRAGRGAPGRPHTEQGPSLPVVGRRRRQKKCREACPPAGQRLDEKKCGEDALSPPLAVTADTRYPPVRRSSPKRTRCRPVPYALVMRLSPGLRSCVP